MSFGSAGPLTVERLWFQRSAKRGDMLFVARCGSGEGCRKNRQPCQLHRRLLTGEACLRTISLPLQQPWTLCLAIPNPNPSSGNNGSDWSSYFAPPGAPQWRSYPASYDTPAMLSVANANCAGGVADTSQRNTGVDIAAPGTSVLSSARCHGPGTWERGETGIGVNANRLCTLNPFITSMRPKARPALATRAASHTRHVRTGVPREFEYIRGALALDRILPSAYAPGNAASPALLMVPAAAAAAPSTVGAALARYPEPRPIQDAGVSTTGDFRPVVECPGAGAPATTTLASAVGARTQGALPVCTRAAGGGVCLTGLAGQRDLYEEACAAMLACVEGGGAALVAYRASDVDGLRAALTGSGSAGRGDGASGGGGSGGGFDGFDGYAGVGPEREVLPGARLNCGAKCECWAALRLKVKSRPGGAMPPGKARALDTQANAMGELQGCVSALPTHLHVSMFCPTFLCRPHHSTLASQYPPSPTTLPQEFSLASARRSTL